MTESQFLESEFRLHGLTWPCLRLWAGAEVKSKMKKKKMSTSSKWPWGRWRLDTIFCFGLKAASLFFYNKQPFEMLRTVARSALAASVRRAAAPAVSIPSVLRYYIQLVSCQHTKKYYLQTLMPSHHANVGWGSIASIISRTISAFYLTTAVSFRRNKFTLTLLFTLIIYWFFIIPCFPIGPSQPWCCLHCCPQLRLCQAPDFWGFLYPWATYPRCLWWCWYPRDWTRLVHWWRYCSCLWFEELPGRRDGWILQWSQGMLNAIILNRKNSCLIALHSGYGS